MTEFSGNSDSALHVLTVLLFSPQDYSEEHKPPMDFVQDLNEVPAMKANMKTEKKRKRATEGIRPSLYNPINTELSKINLPQVLMPALKGIEPKPHIYQLWSNDNGCQELVDTKYGPVPKGSFLSYQAPTLVEEGGVTMVFPDQRCCPPLSFSELPPFYTVLTEQEYNNLEGLTVTEADSLNIEECTRLQSCCPEWHKLRKQRIIASSFKRVFSRQKDFDSVAIQLIGRKPIPTAAMKYGLDHEHEAAEQYSATQQVNTYPVGFIINPSAPYLGCSPDRRVYDPSEEHPWGLLEIKCPQVRSYTEAKCLKRRDDHYKLKKNHAYYVQVMGQMGLSGSQWCDFMVWCENDYHIERIYYDQTYFANLKARLDAFYYMHYLPVIVRRS